MTLFPQAATPIVTIWFVGGPNDGGSGGIQKVSELRGAIKMGSGSYEMQGFARPEPNQQAVWAANFMPDRVIYKWEQRE